MSDSSKRSDRVAQLVQQELGQMLVDGLKDPRIGFATITEVRLTGDLRSARVFVSVYGDEEQLQETLAGLTAANGYLRRELGHRLRLKYTPELTFCADDSLDRAKRVDDIMQAIDAGDTELPESIAEQVVPAKTSRSELRERREEFVEKLQKESERDSRKSTKKAPGSRWRDRKRRRS